MMNLSPRATGLAADLALLLCSLLWGTSFATMKVLISVYPPFWLLAIRFSAGAALILLLFHRRIARSLGECLRGGAVMGALLCAAISTQTVALSYMEAGRQAFLSATYVLMVPLILWAARGTFPGWATLGAACVCLAGMGMLTDLSGPAGVGDALTLLCALLFAFQILAISRYTAGRDPITLSFVEFATLALLCGAFGLLFEGPPLLHREALPELLFTIFFCTFVCYMTQVCAQKYARPSHAAILMSLESVFGLLSSMVYLGETLTLKMAVGCALIFGSVLFGELEPLMRRGA